MEMIMFLIATPVLISLFERTDKVRKNMKEFKEKYKFYNGED